MEQNCDLKHKLLQQWSIGFSQGVHDHLIEKEQSPTNGGGKTGYTPCKKFKINQIHIFKNQHCETLRRKHRDKYLQP
jgi:hypothetical protein